MKICRKIMTMTCYNILFTHCRLPGGFGLPFIITKALIFYIVSVLFWVKLSLNVALQILRRKFYKNTKKSSLHSQSLLIFIHEIPVVENQPTTGEITELLEPRSTPMGNSLFLIGRREPDD